jgi:hypothetical protein
MHRRHAHVGIGHQLAARDEHHRDVETQRRRSGQAGRPVVFLERNGERDVDLPLSISARAADR